MEIRERTRPDRPVRRSQPPRQDPNIVYTQPKPFNRRRFLLRMLTVLAVVLAVIFGMSIFFRVDTVNVAGGEKYTPWQVMEASGIQEGDHLLTLGRAQISGRIISRLPYVQEVWVGIKLPDVVNIEIKELDVVYAVEDGAGSWWLITADGRIVDQTSAPSGYTKLLGVKLDSPQIGKQAKALEDPIPEASTDPSGESVTPPPVTVFASEKLEIALNIFAKLESDGILGTMVSVDVSELTAVELWYGDQFQIRLGDCHDRLNYKLSAMSAAIDQMGSYQRGELDVSFTTWPDQVGYTPFS